MKFIFIYVLVLSSVTLGQDPTNETTENSAISFFYDEVNLSNKHNNASVDLESRFGKRPKASSKKSNNECLLDLKDPDHEKFSPVPIFKDALGMYQEIVPQKGLTRLEIGAEIKFICSGSRNKLKLAPRTSIHSATCVRGTTLKLGNKNHDFSKFECSYIVKGEVQNTQSTCANGQGTYFAIGHKITREDFIKLVGVCYDNDRQIPLYAEHILYGTEIQYASKCNYRPAFSTEGLRITSKFNPQVAYKIESQQKKFENEFGQNFITESMFLARGHLAPVSDFLLATSQFATFFYMNVAPMWQTINNRNWKILENTVRTYSSKYSQLKIITGTHGQISYNDKNNNEVPVFLDEGVLPVPKYFWKIVLDQSTLRAIVFVVYNNPFLKKAPTDLICDDICSDAGWLHSQWKKLDSGYLFCCDIKKFIKIVSTVPNIHTKGILERNSH